ncbi:hypothetical protein HK107_02400 [Parvularcula sp. ZS-1/3]|uniref:Uncharacterized protein n=1 Tax=Parvularcula mediterranea TaxID=2732508 RepID=A0A7Y3RJK9_9PROT|nr:hypothetical protein [Parvularcula mediterranea]NNU15175.1 hypothetical protein [Parvularcula mediterranea]
MNEQLPTVEARQGRNRQFQWRTFLISTGLAASILALLYLAFSAGTA